jgi:DNA-binding FadR family transcriptional regulator
VLSPPAGRAQADLSSPTTRAYLKVAARLLTMIEERSLGVGERLPSERELASVLDVSRPTLREALLALELVGCIDVRVGDGAFVGTGILPTDSWVPLDTDPRELLDARRVIEPSLALHVASLRAAESAVAELAECNAALEKYARDPESLTLFVDAGLEFHRIVARIAGNSLLDVMVGHLIDVATHPLWMLANRASMGLVETRQRYVAEHREITRAIVTHDAALASQLMAAHIDNMIVRFFGHPSPS